MIASVASTYTDILTSVFSSTIAAKAWLASLAVLFTLPVAFHCIFILGFQSTDARVLAHSIVGSFVYGVIAVKLFFVHDRDHPRWTLPLVGGVLFTTLATLWATSSFWYFTQVRFGF